jgi:hypothetical protein
MADIDIGGTRRNRFHPQPFLKGMQSSRSFLIEKHRFMANITVHFFEA